MLDDACFRQPPAEYRPVAMWFLNGDLAVDEVRRQVRAMAAGGVGGVQIAARTGLAIPYLSERWFELVRLIIDEARRHGMDVWLADEYPYPSGAAGGEVVLRHPEYRAWHMRATRLSALPGQEVRAVAPGTVLLRACAVPVSGSAARWEAAISLDAHVGLVQHQQVLFQPTSVYLTTRRYMTSGPRPTLQWRAPDSGPGGPERWEVWLIAAAEIERYKFFGAYVDLCHPDAVRYFLETTYRRSLERIGPERFAHLAGFFVDEAHPQNWSWRLPDYFRRRCGYDLYDVLPALWTDVGERTAQVRYDYLQSLTELFVESFHRPLAEWCRQHGVRLSLEVGSTRNLVQRHADVPGIDPGHEKAGTPLDEILARELPRFRANLSFPASLAAQTGKRRVLDECFHSVGWSLTLQDMKAMLDRAAARGANLFAFHAFCYTTGGLRKWDAPPSEFDQNPYWPYFPLLAAYAGRLAYALSRGRRVAPVALIDPITSLWAHGEGTGAGGDETARRITADWTYLMRELIAAQRPHDNLDPLLLAEATVERGALRVGEAEYRVAILPPVTTFERAAWYKLEAFAQAGGTVIACGLLPCEPIEPESDVVARCAAAFGADPHRLRRAYEQEDSEASGGRADGRQVEMTRSGGFVLLRTAGTLVHTGAAGPLLDLLDDLVPPDLRLVPAAGAAVRRHFLLAQRREAPRLPQSHPDAETQGHEDTASPAPQPQADAGTRGHWDAVPGSPYPRVAASPRRGRAGEAGEGGWGDDLYFVANCSMEEHDCEVALRVADGRSAAVVRLDLETGDAEPLPATLDRAAGELRVRLRFPRHGAHLLLVTSGDGARPTEDEGPETKDEPTGGIRPSSGAVGAVGTAAPFGTGGQPGARNVVELSLDGEWWCVPAGANALRLDRFRFAVTEPAAGSGQPRALDGGVARADGRVAEASTGPGEAQALEDGHSELEAALQALAAPDIPVVEPKPLVNVLQDLARAGRPWPVAVEVAPVFGAPPILRLRLPTTIWYSATFVAQYVPPRAMLCLEDGALLGDWALWVNGQQVAPEAFVPRRRWDAGTREAEIAPLLRPGRNEVLVCVRAAEPWHGLVDALYLLGDFGVTHDAAGTPILAERPGHVRWDDVFGAGSSRGGYPYYAGTLHLARTVDLAPSVAATSEPEARQPGPDLAPTVDLAPSAPPPAGDVLVRLPDEALMFAGVVELAINGRSLGARAWAPYAWAVPAGVLAPGANEVTLTVANTLIGLLEGRRYDPQQRQAVPIVERAEGYGAHP